jgi:molecular chaperone GrpE
MSDISNSDDAARPHGMEPGGAPEQRPASANDKPEARIAELEGQIKDLTDRLLRAHAEMDNMRKRTEREKADMAKYAITKFAGDMIGVADNFQRAIAAVPPDAAAQEGPLRSLLEGVVMTERAFLQALERHNVKRIDPTGELFNPHLHQAVLEAQNPAVPAGTILQVYEVGYVIDDRLLRPASVVVAKGGFKPAKTPDAAAAQPGEDSDGSGNGGSPPGGEAA